MSSAQKPASKQDSLLAALRHRAVLPTAEAAVTQTEAPKVEDSTPPGNKQRPAPVPEPRVSRVGKPVQFWLHEEDRRLIRELAAWLAGQGIRPTDSMVLRAALRLVKTGPGFLEAYRKAALLDGRLRPSKKQV